MLSNFAAFHWSVWPEMKDENENNGNGVMVKHFLCGYIQMRFTTKAFKK